MPFEQKDNSGSLFKNGNKEDERHADWSGRIMVAGKMYWINAWEKQSKAGETFFSLSVKLQVPKSDNPY